ncbi:MAG: carotenoid biosynthesis protein [Rhodococcus sp. (in: high G+C Gram-positive bacteria)]
MNKVVVALAGCAIGAQIVYPLVSGSARDLVTVAVVGFLAAAAITHAVVARGPKWAAIMFVVTAGIGLAAEMVGTATGFPFGSYYYATDRLGPGIVGVPAVVPLAWTAGFYPVWCAVTYVLKRTGASPTKTAIHRVIFTAIGMVGWDLYLDTQMVTDGQWTWTSPITGLPGLPSIPISNYFGWFLVALLMAAILEAVTERDTAAPLRPTRRMQPTESDTVPIVLFVWTWLGSALAHAVLLTGPELRFSAVYGFVVMGVVGVPLLWAWILERRSSPATPVL